MLRPLLHNSIGLHEAVISAEKLMASADDLDIPALCSLTGEMKAYVAALSQPSYT